MNDSIFTTTLERVMHNVGMSMPNESDPSFYRDHYMKEVKKRDGSVLKNKL